jgi:hypothetical protein
MRYSKNIMKISIIFIMFIFQVNSIIYSQTGPGGVGSSTNNSLWLRADAGTFSDAGSTPALNNVRVQQWNDQSGNARNASQSTLLNRPFFHLNVNNGRPALRFTGRFIY